MSEPGSAGTLNEQLPTLKLERGECSYFRLDIIMDVSCDSEKELSCVLFESVVFSGINYLCLVSGLGFCTVSISLRHFNI